MFWRTLIQSSKMKTGKFLLLIFVGFANIHAEARQNPQSRTLASLNEEMAPFEQLTSERENIFNLLRLVRKISEFIGIGTDSQIKSVGINAPYEYNYLQSTPYRRDYYEPILKDIFGYNNRGRKDGEDTISFSFKYQKRFHVSKGEYAFTELIVQAGQFKYYIGENVTLDSGIRYIKDDLDTTDFLKDGEQLARDANGKLIPRFDYDSNQDDPSNTLDRLVAQNYTDWLYAKEKEKEIDLAKYNCGFEDKDEFVIGKTYGKISQTYKRPTNRPSSTISAGVNFEYDGYDAEIIFRPLYGDKTQAVGKELENAKIAAGVIIHKEGFWTEQEIESLLNRFDIEPRFESHWQKVTPWIKKPIANRPMKPEEMRRLTGNKKLVLSKTFQEHADNCTVVFGFASGGKEDLVIFSRQLARHTGLSEATLKPYFTTPIPKDTQ